MRTESDGDIREELLIQLIELMFLEVLLDQLKDPGCFQLIRIFLGLCHLVFNNILIYEIDNLIVRPFLVEKFVPRFLDFFFLFEFILFLQFNHRIKDVIYDLFLVVHVLKIANIHLLVETLIIFFCCHQLLRVIIHLLDLNRLLPIFRFGFLILMFHL